MSTNVSSVASHFPDVENGFTTTASALVSSGAATVQLASVGGYTNGEPVVLVIDPTDASKKQTFTGIMDTAGSQVTSVVWTAGTNQAHSLGATVVDYATATHIAMMSKGIKVEHNQDGTHKAALITSRTEDTSPDIGADYLLTYDTSATALKKVKPTNLGLMTGWIAGQLPSVSSVAANGNRSYNVTFNSTVASYLTPGQRIRTTRTVAAPTQCTSLNGTTQYYSKSSPSAMTFTDDFTVSAWVKLTAYAGGNNSAIASRWNGTSGWLFFINGSGQVTLQGTNAAAANYSQVVSYQSIPLNKWVHVAAQLDMSTFTATTTTSYVMIDGVDVPAAVSRAGTNPTALVQAGNLEIGSYNGGTAASLFTGKIAQVAIYNAKVTQANILATISQGLTGSETSLISAYSFNNSINDLSSNANNLTANGSAVATNPDSPFGGQADGTISSTLDYAEVLSVSTTVATVKATDANTIPTTGGVTSVDLSPYYAPYGMPNPSDKTLGYVLLASTLTTSSTTVTQALGLTSTVTIPTGNRKIKITLSGGYISPNTSAKNVYLSIWKGTVGSGTSLGGFQFTQASANYASPTTLVAEDIPSSGSVTYNVGWYTDTPATASLVGTATQPVILTVEYA